MDKIAVREEEIRGAERKEVIQDIEDLGLLLPAPNGCCIVSNNEHLWWKVVMRLRKGESPKEGKLP